MLEYYQGWNQIPHGNMSPEDLLRMTKRTCPCYTKVFKFNHGMVKIPHGNMSPEDLLRMTKKTCPCYTKVFKFNHGMAKSLNLIAEWLRFPMEI